MGNESTTITAFGKYVSFSFFRTLSSLLLMFSSGVYFVATKFDFFVKNE